MVFRVFTAASGAVEPGAEVGAFSLSGAGVTIPAILIGSEGRGRQLGVLPVADPPRVPCPDRGKEVWTSAEACGRCGAALAAEEGKPTRRHADAGEVTGRVLFAEVGSTKAGKPKLFSRPELPAAEKVIVVLRTPMGFRGGNAHTGDRAGWVCGRSCGASAEGAIEVPESCPGCGAKGYDGPKLRVAEFPGEVICRGVIAEGIAGRMGSGEQLVALIPRGAVFRTAYSGRLYGSPSSHYYKWDGERLLSATWQERVAADIF